MNQAYTEIPLPKLSFSQPGHEKAILKALNEQRRAGKFCDVVLKVEGSEIVAHRAVLSSTFPKLSSSLSSKDCRVLELDGLSPDAVELLVEYSYTSKLDVQADVVFPLVLAAERFGIDEVLRVLEAFIIEKALPQNWLHVWKFAERSNHSRLCCAVENFIESNIETLFQKQDFLRLPRLQIELTGRHGDIRQNIIEPRIICEKALEWVHKQLENEDTTVSGLLEQTHIMYLTPEGTFKECTLEDLDSTIEKFVPTDAQREYIRNSSCEPKSDSRNSSDDEGILIHENNNNRKKCSSALVSRTFKILAAIQSSENDYFGYALINGKVTAMSIHTPSYISCQHSTSSESSGYEDWLLVASMSRGRCSVGATELNGKLYAVGGYDRGACLDIVEVYDPTTNEWMPAAHLNCQRGRFELIVLDNKMYAIGGSNGSHDLNSVECYDADNDIWSDRSPMLYCRSSFGTAVLEDHLYAIGGYSDSHNLKTAERYSTADDTWQAITPLNCGRDNLCAETINGKVYAIGGYNGWTYFNTMECYDPVTARWTLTAPMKTARRGAAAAVVNGSLYVIGGYDGSSFLDTVECYHPETDSWTIAASMNTSRHNVGVAVVGGMIYAVGGFDGSTFLKTVEYYDPRVNKWNTFVLAQ